MMLKSMLLTGLVFFILSSGCSINKMALTSIADGFAGNTGSTFTSDDDIDLVCQALPLSLKAMEALAEKVPDNKGLYLSLSSGYLLYTVASVEIEAEKIKDTDFSEYKRLRTRARNLCYRAYEYGTRGLALCDKDFLDTYRVDREKALTKIEKKEDAALLYWTGAALAKWITFSKDDPSAVIRLPEAVGFVKAALRIDPEFDKGSLYEFFTAYESRSGSPADTARAMEYYRCALKASEEKKLSVYLTYIECFAIPFQDKKAFQDNMKTIMDFDLATQPAFKLSNALTRRKAELLQKRETDLFLED